MIYLSLLIGRRTPSSWLSIDDLWISRQDLTLSKLLLGQDPWKIIPWKIVIWIKQRPALHNSNHWWSIEWYGYLMADTMIKGRISLWIIKRIIIILDGCWAVTFGLSQHSWHRNWFTEHQLIIIKNFGFAMFVHKWRCPLTNCQFWGEHHLWTKPFVPSWW